MKTTALNEATKMVHAFGHEAEEALKDRAAHMSPNRFKEVRRIVRALLKTRRETEAKSAPVIVAVGPFAWGKGATEAEAIKNCKREVPRSLLRPGKHNINVFRVTGFNYVSEMGAINYQEDGACERLATVQLTVRK